MLCAFLFLLRRQQFFKLCYHLFYCKEITRISFACSVAANILKSVEDHAEKCRAEPFILLGHSTSFANVHFLAHYHLFHIALISLKSHTPQEWGGPRKLHRPSIARSGESTRIEGSHVTGP